MKRYTPYVVAVVGGILPGRTQDIEETASDVFFALYQNCERVDPARLKAYLGAAARNMALNRRRSLRPTEPLEEDMILLSDQSLETETERAELDQAVRRAVLGMEQPDREIFLRHYYSCQTVAQIAAALEMGESAVKSRLKRGREKLKHTLIEGGFADETICL